MLHCGTCQSNLRLPATGDLSRRVERCPLCNFEIIQVQKENRNPYFFCPSCYSNPPSQALPDIEQSHSLSMFCFDCCFSACPFSKNVATQPVRKCPDCFKPMTIKSGARGYFLGCSGYPQCKTTASLPECDRITCSTSKCSNCNWNIIEFILKSGSHPPTLSARVSCSEMFELSIAAIGVS